MKTLAFNIGFKSLRLTSLAFYIDFKAFKWTQRIPKSRIWELPDPTQNPSQPEFYNTTVALPLALTKRAICRSQILVLPCGRNGIRSADKNVIGQQVGVSSTKRCVQHVSRGRDP